MKFKLIEDYRDDYLKRTKKHIALVIKYGKKIGKDYSEHDSDKLNELFDAYSLMMKKDNFGGSDIKDNMAGVSEEEKKKIDNATLIHITTNKHHPEYWVIEKLEDFDRTNPPMGLHCEGMPNEYIDEMLCDWCAMSEEFGNTPYEWMEKVIPTRWIFSDDQIDYMKNRLHILWE